MTSSCTRYRGNLLTGNLKERLNKIFFDKTCEIFFFIKNLIFNIFIRLKIGIMLIFMLFGGIGGYKTFTKLWTEEMSMEWANLNDV